MKRHFFFIGTVALWLVTGCTPPPPPNLGEVTSALSSFDGGTIPSSIKAYGTAEIAGNGEVHSGTIETRWAPGGFAIGFYGPFGVSIASIQADSLQGTVAMKELHYSFDLDTIADSMPILRGGAFTFREFGRVLAGIIPGRIGKIIEKRPDSMEKNKKNAIIALWKTDSLRISAEIGPRSKSVDRIAISFVKSDPSWTLSYAGFKNGSVHKIEVRESDTNYFLINYSKVKNH
jgi:hypothetical protein